MVNLQYFLSLPLCWSSDELAAAASAWPESPTWSWMLGEHLDGMDRADVLARVSLAHAHARSARVRFDAPWTYPPRLMSQYMFAALCTELDLRAYCTALGAHLDAAAATP